ncbi:MAG: hypothetical protein GY859_40025 [Desulfobacterales bacterium]|nr:hypothetical protein [Desulfobacterales bacterium]
MKTRALSIMIGILVFATSAAFGADATSLSGGLQTVACTTVCGTCCTGTKLVEKNGGFEAQVKESDVDLTAYLDDGQFHAITGYFEAGAGSCETGECVYFHLTAIGESAAATFNGQTGALFIPNLVVDGEFNYAVELAPPYNLISASPVGSMVSVAQGGDCSAEGAVCRRPTACVEYYGIGGAAGPLFKTCEIPCEEDYNCPDGQNCILIADGPGHVCQNQ